MMVHDLIADPLLSWRDADRGKRMTTLPGILAALASGDLADFPRVRAHQYHPWSMFLTQLAAIALHRDHATAPPQAEDEWRRMLLALTTGAHEPWCIVTKDFSRAAFLQPPVPEAATGWDIVHEWRTVDRPDEVDILVTSKSHDVKQARLDPTDPELWVYAITTLQTMQGYPGRGYNPICRMKGGYGNRPRVGLAPSPLPGPRFHRDIAVLLSTWDGLLERGYADHGIALTWLEPWDGSTSLGMAQLAPHFVELCWRVRLLEEGRDLRCAYTTTSARRCLPEILNGDVGDPWIPIARADGGALTVGPRGFHYELMSHLLAADTFEPAAAQELRAGDGDGLALAVSALARGQGKTEGLHERTLLLPSEVKRRLGRPDEKKALGCRAMVQVERAKTMRSHVLFPALKALGLGDKVVSDDLDSRVDEVFFTELFRNLSLDDQAARLAWERCLVALAEQELEGAIERCSLCDAQRYRAIVKAEALFMGCLRKHFADAVESARPHVQQGSIGVES